MLDWGDSDERATQALRKFKVWLGFEFTQIITVDP